MPIQSRFNKTILSNGVRVVTEDHPFSNAVSIGLWVNVGTRDEDPKLMGISHFLEHLVFKGTKTRNSFEIAKELEEVGGELNAYTTKEYTCYHALVLKDHWYKALDVLCDLACNMSLTKEDFKNEKAVILQELAMSDDDHEEVAHDLFFEKSLGHNPLGWPILGRIGTVAQMTQAKINSYYKEKYNGSQIIISAAGNLQHDKFVVAIERLLKSKKTSRKKVVRQKPQLKRTMDVVEKPTEQIQFILGMQATTFKDQYRFESYIVNALLGGGMTSRLFQNVREKKGLSYNIGSSLNTFTDFGMIIVHASTEKENLKELASTVKKSLVDIKTKGIKKKELDLFKTQVIGQILLGAEDVESRMTSLGVNEMVFENYRPVDEIVELISKVDLHSTHEYIDKKFDLSRVAGLLYGGGASEFESYWKELELC